MLKLVAWIPLAFVLLAGGCPSPANAQDGVATFSLKNSSPYTIHLRMFSRSRDWIWPSATTHYTLDDDGVHTARLTCEVGEKICFGAGWRESDSPRFWGVGFSGTKGCQGCCLTCGYEDEDVSHFWDLVE
jgi:hypothetical protein